VLLARLLAVPEGPNVYRTRIGKVTKLRRSAIFSLSTLRSSRALYIYLRREL